MSALSMSTGLSSMTGWWHPIYAITVSDWWLAHCSPLLGICAGGVCVYVCTVVVVLVVLSGVCGGAGVCGVCSVYVCRCMVTPPQCDDHVSMSMGCVWGTFEFGFNNSRKDSAMSTKFALVFEHVQKRKQELEATLFKVNEQIVQADLSGDHALRDAALTTRAATVAALKEVQCVFDYAAYLVAH